MVVDAAVALLAKLQKDRRIARLATAGLTAVMVATPYVSPAVFGHSSYMLGVIAVVFAAGLTDLLTTFCAATVVLASVYVMDLRRHAPVVDADVRAGVFVVMSVMTAMGAEAFRRFHRSAVSVLAELQRSEALTRTMLQTGPDAMLVIDVHGAVSRFSPAGEALFGWTADEVIGRNINMLMPPLYHREHDGYMARYMQTGERRIIGKRREVFGLKKDGSQFPMMLHVGEVRIGDERYFTGFVHDLTELHAADARTQDLRAQLALIWSMNSLGEMAAVLAHELNQPLSAVTNYLRGARTIAARLELKDDDLIEALQKSGDQAIRAGEIIRRMRNMVTRRATDPKPESLSGLIGEIDYMIDLVVRDGGASVQYRLSDAPDDVLVDRIQIQQVITNLVRNAVEALQNKALRVVAISTARADEWWHVRVEDNGPGLSPDAAQGLFEPLQSDKATGLGLGLSISRTIVESHSGTIWVEDSLLGGAAFCFTLPATTT